MIGLTVTLDSRLGSAGVSSPVTTAVHTQGASSSSWSVNHGLGGFPVVQVLTSSGTLMSPLSIIYVDANNITVNFSSARTGFVLCAIQTSMQFEFSSSSDETVVHGEDFSSDMEQVIATVWLDDGMGNYSVAHPSLEEFNDLNYHFTWSNPEDGFASLVVGSKTILDPFMSPENVAHGGGSYPLVGTIGPDGVTKLLSGVVHNTVNDFDITSGATPVSYVLLAT